VDLGQTCTIHNNIIGNALSQRARAFLTISFVDVPSAIVMSAGKIWTETEGMEFFLNLRVEEGKTQQHWIWCIEEDK
jgi:hypothetical protein